MMGIQGMRWMAVTFTVAACVSGAMAQRGVVGERVQVDRPAMSASGTPVDGAERVSGVSGPSLGYVWDASTRNIHLVSGIAGSSLAGPAVHRGGELRLAAISPDGGFAVVADEAGAVVFYGERGVRGQDGIAIGANAGRVSQAAVSPSGTRFALFAADTGRVEVYPIADGVPGAATVIQASLPAAEVVALALADAGDAVYLISRGGAGSAVSRIAADGSARTVASLPAAIDLAFLAGGERGYVLDAAQNALYAADFGAANPTLDLVASQAEGIDQPLAMALSGDGRSVAIASAATRRATVIELASRASQQVELAEAPTGMRRLNARGVFQLTDAGSGPMLLLEVQAEGARTVYVPRAESGRAADAGRVGLR